MELDAELGGVSARIFGRFIVPCLKNGFLDNCRPHSV